MSKKFIANLLAFALFNVFLSAAEFSYRKYTHVKDFYADIAQKSVEIGLKYNVPPAALLAIAGVESGYGRGYVAHISGNIFSLGAGREDAELPALYLPNLKKDKNKIIYSDSIIKQYKSSELEWKHRPKSLKKDYRPAQIAGTTKELDYFDTHAQKRAQAHAKNMEDFAKNWISTSKKYKPFVEARLMLDQEVKSRGKEILFTKKLNEKFLKMISGKANSFNYRTTWAPKVIQVMQRAGLVELTTKLHTGTKSFEELW